MEKFKGCDLQGTGLRGTPKVLSLGALSSSHSEDWRKKKKKIPSASYRGKGKSSQLNVCLFSSPRPRFPILTLIGLGVGWGELLSSTCEGHGERTQTHKKNKMKS